MAKATSKSAPSQLKPKTTAAFEQDSDGSDAGSLQLDSGSELASDLEGSDGGLEGEASEEEQDEVERPKFAQFMDDSDLEEDDGDDSQDDDDDSDEQEDATHAAYSSDDESDDEQDDLQQQMKQIPFSALMKARQQMGDDAEDDFSEPDISDLEEDEFAQDRQRLAQAKAGKQPQRNGHSRSSQSSDADEALEQRRREVRERLRQLSGAPSTSSGAADDAWAEARKQREQRRKEANERKELVKRANKNAPTEVSSKRPVSRRRNVIETASSQVRDPRFESLSGSVNKDLFAKSYSFLPEMFKDELSTLKKTLAKLKKQETAQAGPKAKSEQALAIRDERAKVEAALRRAEGLAGERERRARESAVKGKIKSQNKEKVEKGLQPFYPKKSEVKQMLLKDKYDRLSGSGNEQGKRASGQEKKQLKKALERRRKKNAQKEKRDMPAGIGFGGVGSVPKRKRDGAVGGDSSKRSRF